MFNVNKVQGWEMFNVNDAPMKLVKFVVKLFVNINGKICGEFNIEWNINKIDCQPCDLSINKPIKQLLRGQFTNYYADLIKKAMDNNYLMIY